ncbi:Serine/threonine protein phosphatase 2C [Mycena chlorophos]|uniref:Serine/threonine protein phosphatase 2C n=1 Tax=Mycena chlorophos TaxID=658473 RepID=A0A8H6SAJ2_MYCCL|nr:Serine/threonine protein phosphatase 2C [Mycena chlorophos]
MTARLARLRFPSRSRVFLGVCGSMGAIYLASTQRRLHADASPISESKSSRPPSFNVRTRPDDVVLRSEVLAANSNDPPEDYVIAMPIEPFAWRFYGVFDGHGGPQCAKYLYDKLLLRLNDTLWAHYLKDNVIWLEDIHRLVKETFLSIDKEMVDAPAERLRAEAKKDGAPRPIRTMAANELQESRSGSSAVVAFYQGNLKQLHVAVVGDCRAVLGRKRPTEPAPQTLILEAGSGEAPPKYDVHVLSVDQTPDNLDEVARLRAAHPNEPQLFRGGSFLGWGITRAFGTGVMKWGVEMQNWMHENVLGRKPHALCQSPPYFTAEPEITVTDVQSGDFMIMASDGFWECLTNEEAVGLVGLWLNLRGGSPLTETATGERVVDRQDLPVDIKGGKTYYERWGVKKRFITAGESAGEVLVRNALGGADKDLYDALIDTPAPHSRLLRDDISLAVVFFA